MSGLVYVGSVESMAVHIRELQRLASTYKLRLGRLSGKNDGAGSSRCLHFKIIVDTKKKEVRQQFLREALKIPNIRDKCTIYED